MSIDACAELVFKGDPDRFRAAMCAKMPERGRLMVLYAFNLEVARAPYASSEPMIAQMRVQWWADAVAEIYANKQPRAHEVVSPLADLVRDARLPQDEITALIEARRDDAERTDPPDWNALERYLAATGGGLMVLAAKALGCPVDALDMARHFGWGAAAANYLTAVPELTARGRKPLPEPHAENIIRLTEEGRRKISKARSHRSRIQPAAPAFLSGSDANNVLKRAARQPEAVLAGGLQSPEFTRRLRLALRAMSGRW